MTVCVYFQCVCVFIRTLNELEALLSMEDLNLRSEDEEGLHGLE